MTAAPDPKLIETFHVWCEGRRKHQIDRHTEYDSGPCRWPACRCGDADWAKLGRAAFDAGRALGLEQVAQIFDAEAAAHARYAAWIGPQRQYYKGARVPDIEMSPMNGPAFAHDSKIARAAQIRALAKETK